MWNENTCHPPFSPWSLLVILYPKLDKNSHFVEDILKPWFSHSLPRHSLMMYIQPSFGQIFLKRWLTYISKQNGAVLITAVSVCESYCAEKTLYPGEHMEKPAHSLFHLSSELPWPALYQHLVRSNTSFTGNCWISLRSTAHTHAYTQRHLKQTPIC